MTFYLKIKASDELSAALMQLLNEKTPGYQLPPEGEVITIDADSILERAGMPIDLFISAMKTITERGKDIGNDFMNRTMCFVQNKSTDEWLHKTGDGPLDFDFLPGLTGAVALPFLQAVEFVKALKKETPEFEFEAIEANKALGIE